MSKLSPAVWFLLFVLAAFGVYLGVSAFVLLGESDDSDVATSTQPTAVDVAPTAVVAPGTDQVDVETPVEPAPDVAGAGDETQGDEMEGDIDPFAPLEFHVDVLPLGDVSPDQDLGTFFQIWMDPETEWEVPRFAVPGLGGGTLDVSFDFVAMTMSGDLDLFYDRLPTDDENYDMLCPGGTPQKFFGTASGAFADFPVVPAPTSEEPPSDWGMAKEDWFPRNEGDWYVAGTIPLDLAIDGIISNGCIELDGRTIYDEFPFDESATVQAWMDTSINIYRNQGADRVTRAEVRLSVTTVDGGEANPNWRYSLWWSDEPDRPIPDPRAG